MTIDHTNQPVDPGVEPVDDLAARVDAEVPPPPESAEPVASAEGVPEAIQARATSTAAAQRPGSVGRGVEWVRPTDLMARHSATLAGRGLTWNTTINQRARDGLDTSARHVGRRAARLAPIAAFGHHRQPVAATRSSAGMS
ncbi:Hypothetical protein PFR_JS9-2_601 [Propionibacterium freudenreichii]|nr:Hypothetical protein PFR_JS9-1_603 [Propionibacterium freudenreichii]SCQ67256.1 Hypothetical protein PFR_JS9-2_601 [Propionibacterium freudenreichii]